MIKNLFQLREAEIFSTLKKLKDCEFAVIGGYAVNAYTLPRFSVDCDIAVKNDKELKKIEDILLKEGYTKEKQHEEAQYSGKFLRYEKKLNNNLTVSIDILIHEITDRTTGAKFETKWVFENSKIRILKGKTITEELNLRIINIDALITMKIISCRLTDIRDIFMMLPNANDKKWIKTETTKRYDFNDRILKIIERINSKQFKDGLSGVYGQFDQKIFEKHKKAIHSFKNNK